MSTQLATPTGWSSRSLAAVILGLVMAFGCGGIGGRDVSGLTEASTNFDPENVKPFLVRVSSHIDGFGPAQIDPLVDEVSLMPIGAEKSWDFDVELAADINQEMATFFDELGM